MTSSTSSSPPRSPPGGAQTALDAAQKAEITIPDLETRAEALREAEADAARLKRSGGTPQTTHPQPLEWDEDAFLVARAGAEKAERNRQ